MGADVQSKRFHFVALGTSESIRGRFADAISQSHKANIPTKYIARLHKTTETSFAMDEEIVSYFLVRLEKPASGGRLYERKFREEYGRFSDALKTILSVPRSELKQKLEQAKKRKKRNAVRRAASHA